MTTLYLPTGPPGSGKTTLARKFVAAGIFDKHAVVSPDAFRLILTGNRADQSENVRVFGICHDITRTRLAHGLDVWFDATNLPNPDALITEARVADAQVVVIRFDVDPDELRRRNERREHPVPPDVLERFIVLHHERFGFAPDDLTVNDEPLTGLRLVSPPFRDPKIEGRKETIAASRATRTLQTEDDLLRCIEDDAASEPR